MWISCIAPRTAEADTLLPTRGDQVATMRLLAAPGLTNGRYDVGVEIAMTPGSHTYWQQPGDAGVPPVFAFNGSTNVADAKVLFPTPTRISESGLEALGYLDSVTFPVVVTPKEAGKPAILKLVLDYAVCNKICIPAHGEATIALAPDGKGSDGDKVTAALARVPVPLPEADADKLTLTPDVAADKPSWTVKWSGFAPVEDIFPMAPEGFYFETRKLGPDTFKLTAAQVSASKPVVRVPVALTLARKGGAYVAARLLDVRAPTR